MTRSTAPALERLREHLFRLTNEIIEEVASGLHSGSPEAVAANREGALREIISRFFPRAFDFAKGKIYDLNGNVSDSMDIVVLAPSHPKFRNARGEIEILLAEGIYCAIELKPDLSDLPEDFGASRKQKPEVIRALDQIQSVKRLRRADASGVLKNFAPLPSKALLEYGHRIPTHLVTTEADPSALLDYIARFYRDKAVPSQEQVDLVLIVGKAVLIDAKAPERGSRNADGLWCPAIVGYDFGNDALAAFLLRLVGDIGPELPMSMPILFRYLRALPEPRVIGGFRTTSQLPSADW